MVVFIDDGRVEDFNDSLEEEYALLTESQKRIIRADVSSFLDENDMKVDLARKEVWR